MGVGGGYMYSKIRPWMEALNTFVSKKEEKKYYRRQIEILLLNNRPHVRIMNLTMQMLLLLKYIEFLVTSKK